MLFVRGGRDDDPEKAGRLEDAGAAGEGDVTSLSGERFGVGGVPEKWNCSGSYVSANEMVQYHTLSAEPLHLLPFP